MTKNDIDVCRYKGCPGYMLVHNHTLEESETIAQRGTHVKLPIPGKKPSISSHWQTPN